LGGKLVLKDIYISMSGACPICNDLLLAAPEDHTLDSAMRILENVFQNHLADKHNTV